MPGLTSQHLVVELPVSARLGKAVAGLNAQSKGKKLGIYTEPSEEEKERQAKKQKEVETEFVEILRRDVPVTKTAKGLRAVIKGETIEPRSVETYVKNKFGENYEDARAAMEKLAKAYGPKDLERKAYDLYEKFRPEIPEGTKGWGAKGELDLDYIRSLAK